MISSVSSSAIAMFSSFRTSSRMIPLHSQLRCSVDLTRKYTVFTLLLNFGSCHTKKTLFQVNISYSVFSKPVGELHDPQAVDRRDSRGPVTVQVVQHLKKCKPKIGNKMLKSSYSPKHNTKHVHKYFEKLFLEIPSSLNWLR